MQVGPEKCLPPSEIGCDSGICKERRKKWTGGLGVGSGVPRPSTYLMCCGTEVQGGLKTHEKPDDVRNRNTDQFEFVIKKNGKRQTDAGSRLTRQVCRPATNN